MPTELGEPQLCRLSLGSNLLSGTIPSEIGRSTAFSYGSQCGLRLYDNRLSGAHTYLAWTY